MLARWVTVLSMSTCVSCGSDSSSPSASGQTGSIGESPDDCRADEDCDASAEAELDVLESPSAAMRSVASATCANVSVAAGSVSAAGSACVCALQGSGTVNIGPKGLGCYAFGRGGDCLWSDTEFEGCTLGAVAECESACAELERRWAADARKMFRTRVVTAVCDQSVCHDVVDIEGRCFADGSYAYGRAYDCSLDPADILERERSAVATGE